MSLHSIRTVNALLLALVLVNCAWALLFARTGPVVGAAVYAMVTLVTWRRREIHPVLIVGFFGLVLHVVELFSAISAAGVRAELIFLVTNVVIPIPLLYVSWKLIRTRRRSRNSE